ncbi:MAG: ABC transporter substrate-binding protein [Christensenellales bacterium]|jgi:NitT/TauT family transport system substrate-binding protein
MKKLLTMLLLASILLLPVAYAEADAPVRVASLKGPTSMGMAKMIHEADAAYSFTIEGTADAIVPSLITGEIDIVLLPCNLASVLYKKTEGAVSVAAINTLGVLYIVEVGDTIHSVEDLKGVSMASTGKGTTPEYALNHVLKANGIDPASDLSIEYMAEATEVASALASGAVSVAMLPQPYVTAACAQNESLRVALSLTEMWDAIGDGSALVTGVVLVRDAFIEERPEAFAAFMAAYEESTSYVNENPAEAAQWIEEIGIAKAAIAEKAIPACNIVCIKGAEMQESISGYLEALYEEDPASVGGALPDEAFYHLG